MKPKALSKFRPKNIKIIDNGISIGFCDCNYCCSSYEDDFCPLCGMELDWDEE